MGSCDAICDITAVEVEKEGVAITLFLEHDMHSSLCLAFVKLFGLPFWLA